MSTEVHHIDREAASKINPIISSTGLEDTLDNASAATREMGYIVTETELSINNLFPLFSAIAAALAWEGDNISHHKREAQV